MPSRPDFTLTVVTSADGLIGRTPEEPPHIWASLEEQAVFLAEVDAADWAVMGRVTHTASDRPDRRRIVFSAAGGAGDWRRPTQVWIDPAGLEAQDLVPLVASVHPLRRGLILGGTRVHDWFLDRDAIDRVHLTVEPVSFGQGMPLFSAHRGPAGEVLSRLGFRLGTTRRLNAGGTRHEVWTRG